jgi:hypothetical protein
MCQERPLYQKKNYGADSAYLFLRASLPLFGTEEPPLQRPYLGGFIRVCFCLFTPSFELIEFGLLCSVPQNLTVVSHHT